MDSNVVYVGIPLTQDGALATDLATSPSLAYSTTAEPSKPFKSSYGLLAFVVGAVLAAIGWVANQGWTIVSVLLFGQFTFTFASAWKHVILCILGSVCTAIAFWATFKMIFPVLEDEDEDEDEEKPVSYKKDIADALQDLGELGFVAGYFSSQYFLSVLVYRPLVGLGIRFEQSNDVLNIATMVFMMLWMLCTKMRDFDRAATRANKEDSSAGFQIV